MSTIHLLKDGKLGKAGAVVSVPYGVGKDLVKIGLAAYPTPEPTVSARRPSPVSPAERHEIEVRRLTEAHAAEVAQIRDEAAGLLAEAERSHAAEVAKLQADLEAANARVTELQTKKK
jgi:hypothetical protein